MQPEPTVRCLLFSGILGACFVSCATAGELPRALSAEEFRSLKAGSCELVSVTATLCYQDPLWRFLFLDDSGHGIFVGPVSGTYQLGDRLKIEGPVGDGRGTPIFFDDLVITKVGTTSLPPPQRIDLVGRDWWKGLNDPRNSAWVELEGEVEQVVLIDDSTRIWCRSDESCFPVTVSEPIGMDSAWDLVGARVRVRGSLGLLLDGANEIQSPLLLTQSFSLLDVVEPPVRIPFPALPNAPVQRTEVDPNNGFHVSGLVTLCADGGLFIADPYEAKFIQVSSDFETPVDTFIEAVGSVDSAGKWRARVIALRNQSLEVWPQQKQLSDLSKNLVGQRVKLEQLEALSYDPLSSTIVVGQDGHRARVQILGSETELSNTSAVNKELLELDSAKSLEILCVLKEMDDGLPVLCVVSRDDITVLSRRWRLSSRNLLLVFGGLALLAVGLGLTMLFLKKQVSSRTRDLSDLAAQLRASYDSVEAGVVAVGTNGKLLTVNGKANSLLGVSLSPGDSADEFVKLWEDQAEDPSVVYEMASAFRSEQGEPSVCEVSLNTAGRGRIRLTLAAINRDGRPIGNLWVMHDETQLKKLQGELLHSQKMDAIGTLAGGIAHDFNNLLTPIIVNLNLLRLAPDLTADERATCIEEAEAACMSAGELVQQLLGMSRKTGTELRVVAPKRILANLKPLLRHGFDPTIVLAFESVADLPPVRVDLGQIEQVLLNLCVNARDAMPDGGKITVGLDVANVSGKPFVVVSVEDTGKGIPIEIRDKIFEPFFTTKDVGKGTGLGLATSFGILQRHNGELRCESVVGEGSKFSIFLPAASPDEITREELLPQMERLIGNETVLVIDDEWLVRTTASKLLKKAGYRTLEAKDGPAGLSLLEEFRDEVDLVLLDVTMPEMSGHEVLRKLRQLYPDLPVLMCSGYDFTGSVETSFEHFIPKPFAGAVLFKEIRRILDKSSRPVAQQLS